MKTVFLTIALLLTAYTLHAQRISLYSGTTLIDVRGTTEPLKSTGYLFGVDYDSGGDLFSAAFGGRFVKRPTADLCGDISLPGSVELYLGIQRAVYSAESASISAGIGWNMVIMHRDYVLPEMYDQRPTDFGPYAHISSAVGPIELRLTSFWATDAYMPQAFMITIGYQFTLTQSVNESGQPIANADF